MDCSNFWKLDKIDKIGICFILFAFVVHSCITCFAVESEQISFDGVINNCTIRSDGGLTANDTNSVYYLEIEPGYNYIVTASGLGNCYFAFGNDLTIGSDTTSRTSVSNGTTFSFTANDFKYIYFFTISDSGGNVKFDLSREKIEGMSGAVDNLSYYAGFNIFDSFTDSLGFVLPVVITCFGIWIISVFIRRFSKGV